MRPAEKLQEECYETEISKVHIIEPFIISLQDSDMEDDVNNDDNASNGSD